MMREQAVNTVQAAQSLEHMRAAEKAPSSEQLPGALFGEDLRLYTELSGREVTTFGLGGPLQLVVEPKTIGATQRLVQLCAATGTPLRVLGAGSNLIINDRGVGGVVLRFGKEFSGFAPLSEKGLDGDVETLLQSAGAEREPAAGEHHLVAFAGASLMGLSRRACAWGLSGLEFAAGIPGSLGGGVKMNAGAHGACLADVLHSVFVLAATGEVTRVPAAELDFGYRRSALPEGVVILGAVLTLTAGEKELISRRRTSCLEYRKRTQPLQLPSAGSTFRNPSGAAPSFGEGAEGGKEISAGMLLECSGLKGMTQGGVQFSPLHANWLVRINNTATAEDALLLIKLAQAEIQGRYQIELEPEVVVW